MKILKEGKPQTAKFTMRGSCPQCGCEIEIEYEEMDQGDPETGVCFHKKCPTKNCYNSIQLKHYYATDVRNAK